jgi:hypothetical protein
VKWHQNNTVQNYRIAILLDFQHSVTKTQRLNQNATVSAKENAMNLPEISDIGLLDAPRHIETFRRELDHCKAMSVDVALAAAHQMLSNIANRQCGTLNIMDVTAVLASIQRAR